LAPETGALPPIKEEDLDPTLNLNQHGFAEVGQACDPLTAKAVADWMSIKASVGPAFGEDADSARRTY
jgi:hypothetical protein